MKYWDKFYQSKFVDKSIKDIPSQFSIFALNEMIESNVVNVIEYGCGTGKDSIFFSSKNMNVIAFDSCQSAIDICNNSTLDSQIVFNKIDNFCQSKDYINKIDGKSCVYTRFFIHALTDDDILSFLENLSHITKPNDLFISEFRIKGDEKNLKETADHFRNFIDPEVFLNLLRSHNFTIQYNIAGKGFAKYRNDDAFVIRIVATRD